MANQNPRKGSYGYTIRVGTGIDMNAFPNIAIAVSAEGGSNSWTVYASTNQVFVGQSVLYSSALGQTFASGQWVYGVTGTAEAFATADVYNIEVIADATARHFISRQGALSVDP
jgi:hypothetical protein